MPRSYGLTNIAPYASAPAVGLAGDEYYNTASKILYISDGSAWNPVSGAAGSSPAYAEVQSTPPPAASPPPIVPPMGLLWVDNSTGTTTWAPSPYYPSQAPPPSGFNSFTDGSGEVWVSKNGSAWKRARDVLHVSVYRNAAFTMTTTTSTMIFDAVNNDAYGLYNPANGLLTVPIIGVWRVTAQVQTFINSNLWGQMSIIIAGTSFGSFRGSMPINPEQLTLPATACVTVGTVGATIHVDILCQSAAAGTSGPGNTCMSCDYLGTG